MSLLVYIAIWIFFGVIFGLGFGYFTAKIIEIFYRDFANAKVQKIGWIISCILYGFVGWLIFALNDNFALARSGVSADSYQYGIDDILHNRISLLTTIIFFLVPWVAYALMIKDIWQVNLSRTRLEDENWLKGLAIFMATTTLLSFFFLKKSETILREQAVVYSLSDVFDFCEYAQATLGEMTLALKSNQDPIDIYEAFRSDGKNLLYIANRIELLSLFIAESNGYFPKVSELSDRIIWMEELADEAFISKIIGFDEKNFFDIYIDNERSPIDCSYLDRS